METYNNATATPSQQRGKSAARAIQVPGNLLITQATKPFTYSVAKAKKPTDGARGKSVHVLASRLQLDCTSCRSCSHVSKHALVGTLSEKSIKEAFATRAQSSTPLEGAGMCFRALSKLTKWLYASRKSTTTPAVSMTGTPLIRDTFSRASGISSFQTT